MNDGKAIKEQSIIVTKIGIVFFIGKSALYLMF